MWSFARKHLDGLNDFNFGVGDHPAALRMRASQGNVSIENRIEILVQDVPGQEAPEVDGVQIQEATTFDARVDALFERSVEDFEFMVERRSDHLNWRLCDSRAGRFTVLQAIDRQGIAGYVALRLTSERGYIADLLTLPRAEQTRDALLSEATRHFQRAGVMEAECWMASSHPYREALERAGFTRRRRTVPLSYRHLRLPEAELAFLQGRRARIHVMAADTDLV
jgi:hypothetical protein